MLTLRHITVCALLLAGCTIDAHRRNTVYQVESVADLRNQELLDNLAMLDANPDLLPCYVSIYAGTSSITDGIMASPTANWASVAAAHPLHTFFFAKSLDINGSRQITQNWSLDPAIVPEKLRALRAAFCLVLETQVESRDYQLLTKYDDKSPLPPSQTGYYFDVIDQLQQLPAGHLWLHRSCRHKDIPSCACYVGEYCGQYVWVEPDGVDALTEFSLIVQRIARMQLSSVMYPSQSTTTVKFGNDEASITANFDTYNLPSNASTSAFPVKGRVDNVGSNSELKAVINAAKAQ